MDIEADFVELDLANVGEGKLGAQFKEAVDKAYAIFADAGLTEGVEYEVGKDKTLRCKIGMEVTLTFGLETRVLEVGSRVKKFEPPAKRETTRMGHMKGGVVLVERVTQADLPLASVSEIKPKTENGEKS